MIVGKYHSDDRVNPDVLIKEGYLCQNKPPQKADAFVLFFVCSIGGFSVALKQGGMGYSKRKRCSSFRAAICFFARGKKQRHCTLMALF